MPAIRLADIPNAGPQALGPSGNLLSPSAPQLTGAAALDPNALAGVAKQMQLDTYNLNAFSGEAAGLANMGDALGDVATVGFRFSQKMQDAKDTADLARAETVMRSAFQKQQNDQLNTPVEKWQERWSANQEQAKKALGEIGLSDKAMGSLAPAWERWSTLSGLQIENQANKQRIEGYKQDIEANALMKIADDDIEGAMGIYNKAVSDGILSESQGNLAKSRLQDNYIRKTKEQRDANVASKIIENPIGAEADLEKAIKTGKSNFFPELTEQSDIVRAYSNARSEANVYRNNIEDDLDQLILSGEITKPEDIRRLATGVLPERRILAAIETLSKTPEQIKKALAMRPTLLAMVDSYDPAQDDEKRTEYLKIKDSIRQLPEGERSELLETLRNKWDNPGESTPVKEAGSQLKTLFDKGQFGSWTVEDGKMPDSEVPKYLAAGKKFAGFKADLDNWAKANPKDAADKTKVYEKLNEILSADKEVQKAKSGGSSWWWPFRSAVPANPALSPSEVRKKIDEPPKTSKADSINKNSSKQDIADAAQEIDFTTPLPELS